MATGGRTARGVLALEEAVAAFPAGGIANAGWVLSVAVARPAARRLGEEALARAPIRDPASHDARWIGRDGGRIDEKQSFREYGHPAMDLSKIDGDGQAGHRNCF
jgi:hypothetical protein